QIPGTAGDGIREPLHRERGSAEPDRDRQLAAADDPDVAGSVARDERILERGEHRRATLTIQWGRGKREGRERAKDPGPHVHGGNCTLASLLAHLTERDD